LKDEVFSDYVDSLKEIINKEFSDYDDLMLHIESIETVETVEENTEAIDDFY